MKGPPMSGIGIITNPHSKLNKRNPARTALLGYILGAQGQLEVTNTLADLSRVAREFKDQGISVLAINGGDGTICRTLTAFIQAYGDTPLPKVALLRGGTINVLASNLAIRGTPEQILFRLVELHSARADIPSRHLRTIFIEDNYGFLFGNGAAASFLKEYYKRKSGALGAAFWAMRVWMSRFFGGQLYYEILREQPLTLLTDGKAPIAHASLAVFAATVDRMPLGYRMFTQVGAHPDKFQCVSFTMAAKDAIWQVPVSMVKSGDSATAGKMSFVSSHLIIEADQPFDYTLDGELYVSRTNRLQIETGPDIEFLKI